MAKILYGVHGTAHGHAIRALTVARHYPEHDFLFVSHAEGADLLSREYRVFHCPNPETKFRAHSVDTVSTCCSNLNFWRGQKDLMGSMLKLADEYKPDVTITDYEFFVPRISRQIGVPCLSLDHQHIITLCSHRIPILQYFSYQVTARAVRHLFSQASDYMVVSFFRAPIKGRGTKLVPPLLRESIRQREPRDGDHVLVYQSTSTFKRFLPFLKNIGRPVTVYGFDLDHTEGNLYFKKPSEEGFLEDLASCSYVISGAGHTLLSEALYFGKPVMAFPVSNAFEQFLNAFYIEKLGYGICLTGFHPRKDVIRSFEDRLNRFRENIRKENFFGNTEIYALLDHFIQEKSFPEVFAPLPQSSS